MAADQQIRHLWPLPGFGLEGCTWGTKIIPLASPLKEWIWDWSERQPKIMKTNTEEGLVNVESCLCTGLHEECPNWFGIQCTFFKGDLPLVFQITFVCCMKKKIQWQTASWVMLPVIRMMGFKPWVSLVYYHWKWVLLLISNERCR